MKISKLLFLALLLIPLSSRAEDSVPIGFIAPLTGPFAKWGESLRRGAELAAEDTKNRLKIDFQDDACSSSQAVGIARKFFSVDKAHFIVGPGCDDCLKAISPIAKQNHAVVFSTGLLGEDVFAANDNVINFATQISGEARRLVRFMSKTGIQKLGVVHGSNSFGEEFVSQIARMSDVLGIQVNIISTPLGTTDFRSILPKLLIGAPEAIFIHQGESETLAFLKQLREAGSRVPIFGPYSVETEIYAQAGDYVDGLTYAYPINVASEAPEKLRFDKRFSEKYGKDAIPSASSYYVYDGVMLLDRALSHCPNHDAECVDNYFRKVGSVKGISGEMTYAVNGSNERPYGVKQLSKRNFIWVDETP